MHGDLVPVLRTQIKVPTQDNGEDCYGPNRQKEMPFAC